MNRCSLEDEAAEELLPAIRLLLDVFLLLLDFFDDDDEDLDDDFFLFDFDDEEDGGAIGPSAARTFLILSFCFRCCCSWFGG